MRMRHNRRHIKVLRKCDCQFSNEKILYVVCVHHTSHPL